MAFSIITEPPLGFVSTVDAPQAPFLVGVDTKALGASQENWEFSIWHNCSTEGSWNDLPLQQETDVLNVSQRDRIYFSASLTQPSASVNNFAFTLKFRSGHGPWQWAREMSGSEDGHIVFRPHQIPAHPIGSFIRSLPPDFSVRQIANSSKRCRIWKLKASNPPASGNKSGISCRILGTPTETARWFALVRHNEHWLGPRQGRDFIHLDKDGILLSVHRNDGLHMVILALSGFQDVLTMLRTNEDGEILVFSQNDGPSPGTAHLLVAVGTRHDVAIRAVFDEARNEIHNKKAPIPPEHQLTEKESLQLADWYDGFAYCTWNGLGQTLTAAKILGALEAYREREIHITNLIIDDNWQSLDFSSADNFHHCWMRFEANNEHFPLGLKDLISRIRKEHPHVQNIAVWHGIFGYWGGMSPTGDIAQKYSMRTFQRKSNIFLGGGDLTTVDGHDAAKFYSEFYQFLRDSGVDAVKTDNQSLLDYPAHADDRANLIGAYQDAWKAAALDSFKGKTIACMAQIPQVIFRCMLRNDAPRLMMRNSDDFFPDAPSSHSWHIFCNAHNAILMEHLNVLPDWDMFQTDHTFSWYHAAARCLSGGPIYVTDIPGEHDISLIEQMTARTADGRRIILRPEKIGKTSDVYIGHSEPRLLKIQTQHRGASLLGVFNVGSTTLREFIAITDFAGILPAASYVIYRHGDGTLIGPWISQNKRCVLEVEVAERCYEIFTAHPVHSFGALQIAVLGLIDKMSGAAAITDLAYENDATQSHIDIRVSLKGLGNLGVYMSNLHFETTCVKLSVHGIPVTATRGAIAFHGGLLTVDLSKLWDEGRIESRGRSDINLDLQISSVDV